MSIGRKMLSWVMIAVMLLSLLPVIAVTAYAENRNIVIPPVTDEDDSGNDDESEDRNNVEVVERSGEGSEDIASVFGSGSPTILLAGCVLLVLAVGAVAVISRKKST